MTSLDLFETVDPPLSSGDEDARPDESWPEVLQRAAEIAGAPAAAGLARVFGGGELYIPRPEAIGEGHPLARAMGLAGARAFARELGGFGSTVSIPLGPNTYTSLRRAAVAELTDEGRSQPYIGRKLGMPDRSVRRWQKRIKLQREAARLKAKASTPPDR